MNKIIKNKIVADYINGTTEEVLANKYNVKLIDVYEVTEVAWSYKQISKYYNNSNNLYKMSIKDMIHNNYTIDDISDMFSLRKMAIYKYLRENDREALQIIKKGA